MDMLNTDVQDLPVGKVREPERPIERWNQAE